MQELTHEAKVILGEAANGDGIIMSDEVLSGRYIQVNGKSLIPSNEPSTVALWTAGLDDLLKHRYVRVRSRKSGIYEVTREGYKVAEAI